MLEEESSGQPPAGSSPPLTTSSAIECRSPTQGQPDASSSGPEAQSGPEKASGSGAAAASDALERAKGKRPLEVSQDAVWEELNRAKRPYPGASGSEQGQAVREPPAPGPLVLATELDDPEEVREELVAFLSAFSKQRVKSTVLSKIEDQLDLGHAWPEKFSMIRRFMRSITAEVGPDRPKSTIEAGTTLADFIASWEERKKDE